MTAMDYAQARLRSQDEARSAQLARDPRVYVPDDDEGGPTPCVICEAPSWTNRGLVCARCRDAGWSPRECRCCGSFITQRDRMTKGELQGVCKRCREDR